MPAEYSYETMLLLRSAKRYTKQIVFHVSFRYISCNAIITFHQISYSIVNRFDFVKNSMCFAYSTIDMIFDVSITF